MRKCNEITWGYWTHLTRIYSKTSCHIALSLPLAIRNRPIKVRPSAIKSWKPVNDFNHTRVTIMRETILLARRNIASETKDIVFLVRISLSSLPETIINYVNRQNNYVQSCSNARRFRRDKLIDISDRSLYWFWSCRFRYFHVHWESIAAYLRRHFFLFISYLFLIVLRKERCWGLVDRAGRITEPPRLIHLLGRIC